MSSKNCKACGEACVITASQSVKNPGKLFWACPNHCANAFNGFVDPSKKSTPKPQKQTWPQAAKEEKQSLKKICTNCDSLCVVRVSQSAKNAGKQYHACKNCDKPWNGWIKDEQSLIGLLSQKKTCVFCTQACVVHITRFIDKPQEVFFKCPFCNLFNGFLETSQGKQNKPIQEEETEDDEL